MVKVMSFSSRGHDVLELSVEDAVSEAKKFVENYKGRIVSTKFNKFISPNEIKEGEEVLLLNQLQGG